MTLPNNRSILHRQFLSARIDSLPLPGAVRVFETDTISDAVRIIQKEQIGGIVVTDTNDSLRGILTERDLLRASDRNHGASVTTIMTPDPRVVRDSASVARALYNMSVGGFRRLPVVSTASSQIRMLSVKNLLDHVYLGLTKKLVRSYPIEIAEQTVVDQFFASRIEILNPQKPVVARESDSIEATIDKLQHERIGSVAIVNTDQRLSGIFTERDYLLRVALSDLPLSETPISKVMTEKPQTALISASVSMAFNLMSEGGYRHIPVVDFEEDLTGMLSVKNFVDYLAAGIIEDLEEEE